GIGAPRRLLRFSRIGRMPHHRHGLPAARDRPIRIIQQYSSAWPTDRQGLGMVPSSCAAAIYQQTSLASGGEGDAIRRVARSSSMPHATPVVFVVDDDVSVRESLEALIRFAGWQVQVFATAREFLAHRRVAAPSCLVLDLALPDLNGLDLQKRVAADRPDMPIIFITGYGDVPTSVQAMKKGAVEFLTKPFSDDILLDAIRDAIERSRAAFLQETELQTLRERHASLSRREQEVMALVVSGLLNKQVGYELGISEITVKTHRGNVMRKMGAPSLAALVTMAARLGLREADIGVASSGTAEASVRDEDS